VSSSVLGHEDRRAANCEFQVDGPATAKHQ